jgi:NAD(P)-dependent dehydrogenase (short-subunit alcohol dehydrogenase family)
LRFKDKTSIVTGGGSGIGLETAKRLHAEGARVLLNGRDEAKLRAAAAGFGQSDRVAVFSGDIAKPATSLALVQAAEREFGGVDILINNAGVF